MVYLGSKNKYCKYLIPIFEKLMEDNHLDTFIDLCVGGANIIDKIKNKKIIANDINKNLIELYKYVYNTEEEEIKFPAFISSEEYKKYKESTETDWHIALAEFFTTYSAGSFNGYALKSFEQTNEGRNYYEERIKNFKKQIPLLKNKDITWLNKDILKDDLPFENCFIYIDPPYKGTKRYRIKNFDYDAFYKRVIELSENNLVLFSEQEAPDIFEEIWNLETSRANSFTANRTALKVTEKLFIYPKTKDKYKI